MYTQQSARMSPRVRHFYMQSASTRPSISSSYFCAGQRLTPHNRTLEVRPGRITNKLELKYDYDCERDDTKNSDDTNSLLGVLMFGWDVVIANMIDRNKMSVCLPVCLSVHAYRMLVYGSCMMLVSVRCPLRPG